MMVTVTQATSQSNSLIDYVKQVFIIAYKEPTEALESCFREEGFNCEVLRQKHLEEYKGYSNSYLTLLNHCQAWQRIIQENKPTLIIEADFVPVVGISQLPLPFNPRKKMWVLLGYIPALPNFIMYHPKVLPLDFLPLLLLILLPQKRQKF